MTEHPDHPPCADDPGATAASPGAMLRKLREEAGLGLPAVSEALHLTVHYVKALENDEYGKLPGLTFVKGYLRSYARLLKADVDMVLALFDQHIALLVDAGIRTGEVQRSRRRHDQALRWALATGFIIVAGLGGGWWYTTQGDNAAAGNGAVPAVAANAPRPVTPAPAPAPVQTARPGLAPAPGAGAVVESGAAGNKTAGIDVAGALNTRNPDAVQPAEPADALTGQGLDALAGMDPAAEAGLSEVLPVNEVSAASDLVVLPSANGGRQLALTGEGADLLQLQFTGNSWVEIDDGQRKRLYSDMLRAGDALTVQGEAPFHVLFGDARQVQVRLNSEAVDIAAAIRSDSTARVVLDDAMVQVEPGVTH